MTTISSRAKFDVDPDSIRWVEFRWTRWLAGRTIDSYELYAQPGLNVLEVVELPTAIRARVSFSASSPGTDLQLTCRVTTTADVEQDDKTITFAVNHRSTHQDWLVTV